MYKSILIGNLTPILTHTLHCSFCYCLFLHIHRLFLSYYDGNSRFWPACPGTDDIKTYLHTQ